MPNESPAASLLKRCHILRDEIRHEDNIVTQGLSWLRAVAMVLLLATVGHAAETKPRPMLPEMSGKVEIEVRDGAEKPPRQLAVHLVYPKNRLSTVSAKTGLML